MQFVILIGLAIATSLDSLGVGIAYGLSGTRVRPAAHVCISVIMMAITWAAVAGGNQFSRYLPDWLTHLLSASFFIGVGIWMLAPMAQATWKRRKNARTVDPNQAPTLTEVLSNPELADRNASRDIDVREALLLGVALSLNNIGGGLSAGMIHISPFGMASWSVFFNVLCLTGGHLVGKKLSGIRLSSYAQILSGLLMIAIGLYELKPGS
jgi:putative sporulation protein YtaF